MIKNILIKITGFIGLIVFIGFIFQPSPAFAKSYTIDKDEFRIQLSADKSAFVSERLTYNFDGSFTWAEMWIPTKVVRNGNTYNTPISDFSIKASDNSPVTLTSAQNSSDKFYAKWSYTAENQRKTFIITYTIENAVRKYQDVAQFYWQIIGNDWQVYHDNVDAYVTLPSAVGDKSQVLVYGHGPLNGSSEIVDNQTTHFHADSVASKQFMEIRTVFPSLLVNDPIDGSKTFAQIKSEEAKYVEETIAAAKREQLIYSVITKIFAFMSLAGIFSPALWFIIWYLNWKKYGKEYPVSAIPDHQFDLPSKLPPAQVEVLLTQGATPSTRAFVATIFDLARKGFIEVHDETKIKGGLFGTKKNIKTTLVLKDKNYQTGSVLLDYEKDLLDLVFFQKVNTPDTFFQMIKKTVITNAVNSPLADGSGVTISALKDWIKDHPIIFQDWFKNWTKTITTGMKQQIVTDEESNKAYKKMWIITIVMTVIFFPVGFINLIIGAIFNRFIKRWSKSWVEEAFRWQAFKKFLDDFARFKEIPPEAYKLWEYYLVFGILFGNAEGIIKMLPIILKNPDAAPALWYYWGTTQGIRSLSSSTASLTSMVNSLNVTTSELRSASTSAAHYSSGGGGAG